MLSCTCNFYDSGWYYYPPCDFSIFKKKRRKRCCSCKELIGVGDECVEFEKCRDPATDIEERIVGDEVPMASDYMCEKCGEIYFNLTDLGYCINLGDEMQELLQEYWEMTKFKKAERRLKNE